MKLNGLSVELQPAWKKLDAAIKQLQSVLFCKEADRLIADIDALCRKIEALPRKKGPTSDVDRALESLGI